MEGGTWGWVTGTPRGLVPVLARPGGHMKSFGEALIKCGHFSSRGIAREIRVYPRSVIFKLAFAL